jgi:hypothetical protein
MQWARTFFRFGVPDGISPAIYFFFFPVSNRLAEIRQTDRQIDKQVDSIIVILRRSNTTYETSPPPSPYKKQYIFRDTSGFYELATLAGGRVAPIDRIGSDRIGSDRFSVVAPTCISDSNSQRHTEECCEAGRQRGAFDSKTNKSIQGLTY